MTDDNVVDIDAKRLLKETLVWDNHLCLPMDPELNAAVLPQLENIHRAGVDVVSVNIGFGALGCRHHLMLLAQMRRWLRSRRDKFVLPQKVSDIIAAKDAHKLAIIFDIEGGHVVENNLSMVSMFYDLGVRWMLVAYNRNNALGGGCHDHDEGLTPLGRDIIMEMADVGMVACCSHTGYRTAREVMEINPKPTIFSHSNVRSLVDHPRNIPDDLIRLCAQRGGAVGINGVNIFLGGDDPSPRRLAEHIDYVVQLVGIDHVGVSLDYSPGDGDLQGELSSMPDYFPGGYGYEAIKIMSPYRLTELTSVLLGMGYSSDDVRQILGGNFFRIALEVWR